LAELKARPFLPALLGALHQEGAEGELVLEQNDGTRTLFWKGGDLRYLRSDAVGEQFGNYLIRLGILDLAALQELLADGEGSRMGDRVVQWGLMTTQERDQRLQELLASILTHAMEHPVLKMTWTPGALSGSLSGDLQFKLDHRKLIWDVFQRIRNLHELRDYLKVEPTWRWKAKEDLLFKLSDLPLNPKIAYALSLLGTEPLGYETLTSITGLEEEEAAHIIVALWALGGLTLTQGEVPVPPGLRPHREPGISSSGGFTVPPRTPQPARPSQPINLRLEPLEVAPPPPPSAPLPDIEVEVELDMDEPMPPMPALDVPSIPLRAERAPEPQRFDAIPSQELEAPPSMSTPMPPMDLDAMVTPEAKAKAYVKKAQSLLLQDRASEAIRALEQSIKLDGEGPRSYEAWMLLGKLRLANPAWSTRAIEALQAASRANERAAEPWALMGELYHRKGFLANAQGCFKKALELDPSVQVPDDVILTTEGGKAAQGGLFGRLKSMLGREKE
jgi:tetratricopeptide (TPR) repeat protein